MHRMLWLDDLREDKGYYYAANIVFPLVFCFLTGYAVYAIPLLLREAPPQLAAFLAVFVFLLDFFNYRYLSWRNRRYSIDAAGVTVRGFFLRKTIPWTAIREAGLFSVRLAGPRSDAPFRTFLLLFPCRSHLLTMTYLDLDRCWFFGGDALSLRMDEQRLSELKEAVPFPIPIYDWNELHWRYEPRKDDWQAPPCPFAMRKDWEAYCARQAAREAKRRKKR